MRAEVATALATAWNNQWPEGSAVEIVDDMGEARLTRTRSEAFAIGGRGQEHSVLVKVEGRAGGYALERIVPVRGGS